MPTVRSFNSDTSVDPAYTNDDGTMPGGNGQPSTGFAHASYSQGGDPIHNDPSNISPIQTIDLYMKENFRQGADIAPTSSHVIGNMQFIVVDAPAGEQNLTHALTNFAYDVGTTGPMNLNQLENAGDSFVLTATFRDGVKSSWTLESDQLSPSGQDWVTTSHNAPNQTITDSGAHVRNHDVSQSENSYFFDPAHAHGAGQEHFTLTAYGPDHVALTGIDMTVNYHAMA